MENGILTIRGQKESEKKEEREGFKRIERAFGSFYRRFSLPDTADAERLWSTRRPDDVRRAAQGGRQQPSVPPIRKPGIPHALSPVIQRILR